MKFLTEYATFKELIEDLNESIIYGQDERAVLILRRVYLLLLNNHPWYGDILSALKIFESKELNAQFRTMCTDGYHIAYHPEFIHKHNENELLWTVCHELMHCILKHRDRRGTRPALLWNVAGDYAINLLIEGVGERDKGALYDNKFDSLSTEKVYELLYGYDKLLSDIDEIMDDAGLSVDDTDFEDIRKKLDKNKASEVINKIQKIIDELEKHDLSKDTKEVVEDFHENEKTKRTDNRKNQNKKKEFGGNEPGDQKGQPGKDKQKNKDKGKIPGRNGQSKDEEGEDGQGTPGGNSGGSHGHYPPTDIRDVDFNDTDPDKDKNRPKGPEERKEYIKKKIMEASKFKGTAPGNLKRFLDSEEKAKIDWRKALKAFLSAIVNKRTYVIPNRRFIYKGLNIHGIKNYQEKGFKYAVIGVDTSGSISDKFLAIFASEIKKLCRDITFDTIFVLSSDAKVHDVKVIKYKDINSLKLEFSGGGGSDAIPAFRWTKDNIKNLNDLAFMIYITDGAITYPKTCPWSNKTLWVIMNNPSQLIPFGKAIYISPDEY
jgi:predicted metal-dependent peptidase